MICNVYVIVFCFDFSAALDVALQDEGFPEADFEVVRGNLEVKWDRIAPYPFSTTCYIHSPSYMIIRSIIIIATCLI